MKTTWFLGISKHFRNQSSHIFLALPFVLGLCFCHLLCGGSSPPVRRSLGSSWVLYMWESLSRRIKLQELASIKQNLLLFMDLEDRNVHAFFLRWWTNTDFSNQWEMVWDLVSIWTTKSRCLLVIRVLRLLIVNGDPGIWWRSLLRHMSPVLLKEVPHRLGMSPLAFACFWRKSSL